MGTASSEVNAVPEGSVNVTPEERVAMLALALMAEGHDGGSEEDSIVRMANLLGSTDEYVVCLICGLQLIPHLKQRFD
jgi:hypothetical protein